MSLWWNKALSASRDLPLLLVACGRLSGTYAALSISPHCPARNSGAQCRPFTSSSNISKSSHGRHAESDLTDGWNLMRMVISIEDKVKERNVKSVTLNQWKCHKISPKISEHFTGLEWKYFASPSYIPLIMIIKFHWKINNNRICLQDTVFKAFPVYFKLLFLGEISTYTYIRNKTCMNRVFKFRIICIHIILFYS